MNEQAKTCTLSEVMPPERANFTGHIHGGYIMLLMDRVAYACAARYSKKDVVTVSVDQVNFKQPIFVGELVTFMGHVNYVGNSSMEIGVKIIAEDLKTGVVRHTNTCYINMVAIDENRKPTKIPPLVIESEQCELWFEQAKQRRQIFREQQQRHKDIMKRE
ncbi:MAG: acyl-CoA thioesterase [Coxiella sp. (in: Bacteria)]|nr:MAG: acyl-CoA thioesterase [Coxiella sp. (in: g-proteobacteria)]